MLARTSASVSVRALPSSRACRCTSTSVSPPCPHAARTLLTTPTPYHDRVPLSPIELDNLRLPSEEALEYTAPLWEHQFQYFYETAREQHSPVEPGQLKVQDKEKAGAWFRVKEGVRRRDWRGWIRESRVVQGKGVIPGSPPPPAPTTIAATLNSTTILGKDQQSTTKPEVESLDRSIAPSSTAPGDLSSSSSSDPQLAAEHLARLQRTAHQLGGPTHAHSISNAPIPATQATTLESQAAPTQAETEARSTLESYLSSSSPSSITTLDQLSTLWTSFSLSSSTDLRSSIEDFQLSLSLLFHLASPSTSRSFSHATTNLLELALSILRTLLAEEALAEEQVAAPPSIEGLGKEMVLRFVLLRTVVSAALGDGNVEFADRAVRELVTLRRVVEVEVQVDQKERDLVLDVAEAMVEQHRRTRAETYRSHLHPSLVDVPPSTWTLNSRAAFGSSEPITTPETRTPLLDLHSLLLDCIPLSSLVLVDQHAQQRISTLLNALAREAVALRRWDVLSSLFLRYSFSTITTFASPSDQWTWTLITPRYIRGLAKYWAGELILGGAQGGKMGWGRGGVRRREWEELVVKVGKELRGMGGEGWGEQDWAQWIELLCSSSLSSSASWEEAVLLYTHWNTIHPTPLPLKPSTLLTLARRSLSLPPTFPHTSPTSFAQSLATSYLSRLTSPSSSFTTPTLSHYDLTSLASLYSLLGDQASVGQVYKKMLEIRVLPDRRDVQVVLETSWEILGGREGEGERYGEGEGRGAGVGEDLRLTAMVAFLKWAHGVGVQVDKEVFEGVLRRVFRVVLVMEGEAEAEEREGERDRQREVESERRIELARRRGKKVLSLAKEVGLPVGERRGLKSLVRLLDRQLVLNTPGSSFPTVLVTNTHPPLQSLTSRLTSPRTTKFLPSLLYRQLRLASGWKQALILHDYALTTFKFQDDQSISLVLRSLLSGFATHGPPSDSTRTKKLNVRRKPMKQEREDLRRALRSILERILHPPSSSSSSIDLPLSPVTSQMTADLVISACFKVGERVLLEKVVESMFGEGGAVRMREEMGEKIRRWVGRE